jgi:hypothetical protein|tara:strand:- start:3315 stop:3524 length:210 start_codon:yes stop_codon:yes gene_type:complete
MVEEEDFRNPDEAPPKEVKKKVSVTYEATQVPTQMIPAIKNNKEDRVLIETDAIVEILNKLDRIEKAVA